jgi:hypothetical protein
MSQWKLSDRSTNLSRKFVFGSPLLSMPIIIPLIFTTKRKSPSGGIVAGFGNIEPNEGYVVKSKLANSLNVPLLPLLPECQIANTVFIVYIFIICG